MTWRQEAAQIIDLATRHLPADTTLQGRKKVIDAAFPWSWRGASWPRKAWQAARRDYLTPYGYQPRTKKAQQQCEAALPLFD